MATSAMPPAGLLPASDEPSSEASLDNSPPRRGSGRRTTEHGRRSASISGPSVSGGPSSSSAHSTKRGPIIARLTVIGSNPVINYDVYAGETIIGRDEGVASVILPGNCVSGAHATLEVHKSGMFHFISDSSTNGTWIVRWRDGKEASYRLKHSIREPETTESNSYYRYQILDGEIVRFADCTVRYDVMEPWKSYMGISRIPMEADELEEIMQTAPLATAPRLVDDSQIPAPKVSTKEHPAEVLVLDSAPPKVDHNKADSLLSEVPKTGHGTYLSAIPAPASDDMDEAEDKPAAAAIAPASVKEDDVRFSEFIEMEEGSRGTPGAAKEPEKEPALARAEVEEPTKEQESDPMADIAVSGRESQAAVDGVAPQVEVVPDEGPASGQAASEDIEPLVKAKAARKPRKKASAAEVAEPVEPETASRSKKKTVKAVEHVPEPKEEEAVRARTPIPDFKEVQAEAARTVGLSEPASSSPIGGKRRKGKALEVWSDDESGEDKAPSPKPFKIAQTTERPPKDTAPEGGETLQEKGKEKPKKKASGKSATTAAVSAATPGPQTRVSPRKTGRGKAATTERDLFSVPSSATDVVVRDEKEQEKSVKRQKKNMGTGKGEPSPARRQDEDIVKAPNLENRLLPKIIFTGLDDGEIDSQSKIVFDLGGDMVDDWREATHLVTDGRVRRTVKFLCALAKGKPIVGTQWLEACKRASTFADEVKFTIRDRESEKKWGFSLVDSLAAARTKPLLQGKTFYLTAHNTKPAPADIKEVIEAAGGMVTDEMPDPSAHADANQIVLGCETDEVFCKRLVDKGITCVTNEYVLSGILRQALDTEEFALLGGKGGSVGEVSPSKGVASKRKRV